MKRENDEEVKTETFGRRWKETEIEGWGGRWRDMERYCQRW